MQCARRVTELFGAAAPSEQTADAVTAPAGTEVQVAAAPAPLDFDSATLASDPDTVLAWLQSLPEDQPLALCISDSALSMACGKAFISCTLGGDLLTPGMDPAEVLSLAAPVIVSRPAIVHDGKALLHLLKKYGLPQPERFDWDVMLGAYLIDPQLKSYTLLSLL